MFQKTDEYGFKLGSEKCEFFMKQMKYLGQIIDENGRRPGPERAEGNNNWIHTFPKGISAMWNAISLVDDLNSCRRIHFLRR